MLSGMRAAMVGQRCWEKQGILPYVLEDGGGMKADIINTKFWLIATYIYFD